MLSLIRPVAAPSSQQMYNHVAVAAQRSVREKSTQENSHGLSFRGFSVFLFFYSAYESQGM